MRSTPRSTTRRSSSKRQGLLRQPQPFLPSANEAVMHAGQYAFRDRRARKGEFRSAVDPAHQRRLPSERHQLQPVHRRPQGGRRRGRPQDPRRPRRARRRRVHERWSTRRRLRSADADGSEPERDREPSLAARNPRDRRRCGASRGAAVRVPRPAATSSTGPRLVLEALDAGVVDRRGLRARSTADGGRRRRARSLAARGGAPRRRTLAARGLRAVASTRVAPARASRVAGPPEPDRGRARRHRRSAGARARRRRRPRQRRHARPRRRGGRASARSCCAARPSVDGTTPRSCARRPARCSGPGRRRRPTPHAVLATLHDARAPLASRRRWTRRSAYTPSTCAAGRACVLGSEAHGLPPAMLAAVDVDRVRIPMLGARRIAQRRPWPGAVLRVRGRPPTSRRMIARRRRRRPPYPCPNADPGMTAAADTPAASMTSTSTICTPRRVTAVDAATSLDEIQRVSTEFLGQAVRAERREEDARRRSNPTPAGRRASG